MAISQQNYAEAAKAAAGSPGNLIRNEQTINALKAMPAPQTGGPQPILLYFITLLELVKLNEIETMELCRPVL
jgi:hypothetical protein